MTTTFNIDGEMIVEMRYQASTIIDVDGFSEADITLDSQIPMENPQPAPPSLPAEPSREARIAHFTKLVEQGEPLFPATETDDDEL